MDQQDPAAAGPVHHCATCGGPTHHDRFGCVRCRLIHEQRQLAAARASQVSNTRRNIGGLIFLGILVAAAGNFHCTHGGSYGFHLVPKEEWGFYDQFVDMGEIEGTPIITQLGRARTIRALIRHGAITLPESWQRDDD